MGYIEIELKELKKISERGIALIVTATDTETDATHSKLEALPGYSDLLQVYDKANTYYCGLFGKYCIVHVQSNMGSIGRDSAIKTISNAIRTLKPKFVVMIGIAFGIDDEKQNIGDVLIAEGILPYDNKRVGERTIQRGQNAPSSKILLNRFKSVKTWQYLINDSVIAKKIIAQILSGEELIDNKVRRDELVREFPTSKGGEMEGAGLFAACDGDVDWILIKGICDYADGNKGANKKQNQNIAIYSALSLCLEVFNSKHAFSDLGLNPILTEKEVTCTCNYENAEKILFEVYDKTYEQYYIKRECDEIFSKILEQYCIWIHGISGCGKTNLILRNLIKNRVNFFPISLAFCLGVNVLEVFREILYELESRYGKLDNTLKNNSFSNICRNILALLEYHFTEKSFVIFIEEIPISNDKVYKEFISYFFSLLILKKLKHGLNKVKFILSSIKNPTSHILQDQLKIHQQIKFVELRNWEMKDIQELIDLICRELEVNLDEDFIVRLISISEKSPRFIKKFFRNVLACCTTNEIDYENILKETDRELKQYYHE